MLRPLEVQKKTKQGKKVLLVVCGSTRHLIVLCPSYKIYLLKSRVSELETRVEEFESAMIIKENNKKKLIRKRKKKQIKKKKKKHKMDVKVMDIAVKIWCHLLREEKSWSGSWLVERYQPNRKGTDKNKIENLQNLQKDIR